MKIVAINKVLNEAEFIADYCHNHRFCDLILIADGGSTDETVKIAQTFDNVRVRSFDKQVELPDGGFMNPEPAHTNFLLDWADEEGADWVLFVGCDTWPDRSFRRSARAFLNYYGSGVDAVMCNTVYLWGEDHYFPKINKGAEGWALRGGLGLRCDEDKKTFFETRMIWPKENTFSLPTPYFLLHHYGSPKRTPQKLARYAAWGFPQKHPLESEYAPPEPLPDWVKWGIPERVNR